ncbi:unnamed protein product [Tuber aestivum]|uniref:Magnesium transporter n=1 Tax=Tuber aestivum TaxID=59557 RepID=A0A292PL64_9PEZI|nr:unnamed protein product [Tuber aestivum]
MASKALISFSSLLLIHSCYSAHEHSLLMPTTTSLPLDVAIETIVSVVLLCFGIVLGNREELKPISWSVWSGLLEREKGCGQFGYLEERVGFLDIRAKRAEFAKWIKGAEVGSSSQRT